MDGELRISHFSFLSRCCPNLTKDLYEIMTKGMFITHQPSSWLTLITYLVELERWGLWCSRATTQLSLAFPRRGRSHGQSSTQPQPKTNKHLCVCHWHDPLLDFCSFNLWYYSMSECTRLSYIVKFLPLYEDSIMLWNSTSYHYLIRSLHR